MDESSKQQFVVGQHCHTRLHKSSFQRGNGTSQFANVYLLRQRKAQSQVCSISTQFAVFALAVVKKQGDISRTQELHSGPSCEHDLPMACECVRLACLLRAFCWRSHQHLQSHHTSTPANTSANLLSQVSNGQSCPGQSLQ